MQTGGGSAELGVDSFEPDSNLFQTLLGRYVVPLNRISHKRLESVF